MILAKFFQLIDWLLIDRFTEKKGVAELKHEGWLLFPPNLEQGCFNVEKKRDDLKQQILDFIAYFNLRDRGDREQM